MLIRTRLFTATVGMLAAVCIGCAAGESGPPLRVSEDGAVVGGRVVSDVGGEVEYWAQYGPTTSYGSETAHATVTVEPRVPRDVAFVGIDGLQRDTTYHYRLCARDSRQRGGPGCGADRTFTTQSFACGETVTSDVRLTGDVFCSGGTATPGLAIGADGVDVNLNGFELIGPLTSEGFGPPGIDNTSGFDDVTVRNGTVGYFGQGIRIESADRNRIVNVTSLGSWDGINILGGEGHEVRRSEGRGRQSGIVIAEARRVLVADSRVSASSGDGLPLLYLDDSRIIRNTVVLDGPVPCCEPRGIVLYGYDNVLKDNRVGGWSGGNLVVTFGARNRLIRNEAFGGVIPQPPAERETSGDGIFITINTADTMLRGNFAHDNAGDGIEVESSITRLARNRANDNGDFGIDAVAGVVDRGGNRASGNANPLQCRNVFCR